MKFGIAQKIVFLFILLIIVLGIVVNSYFVRYLNRILLSEFNQRAKVLLNSLIVSSEYPVLVGDIETLDRIGKGALEQRDVVYCEIRDKQGKILFKGGLKPQRYVKEYSLPILTEKIQDLAEELILGSEDKQVEEIGKIYLSLSLGGLMKNLNGARNAIGFLVLAGILLSALFISLLIRFILGRPVDELVRGIKRISAGELSYRVPIKTKDEIGSLALSFNEMNQNLQKTTTSIDNLNREIAERKKAELEAEQYYSLVKASLESTADGILVVDSQGKITSFNQKFVEMWHIPNEIVETHDDNKALGFVLSQLKDPEAFAAKVKELYSHPDKDSFDTIEFKDGRFFERYSLPQRIKDKIVGRVWSFRDVTERKRAEQEKELLIKELKEGQETLMKQKLELEKSRSAIKNVAEDLKDSKQALEEKKNALEKINVELDDFTYIVSHDLKEPLRSIDAFSKFVLDDYKDKLDEQSVLYLNRLRANAGRMQALIEDLLELSRIERRKNPIEEVEVKEIINELKLRLEYSLKEKKISLVISDKLPKIFCDRTRLTEVFINLVSNAVKFNDKPNPVIEIGCADMKGFNQFYVKDNGPGIEEKYFSKIFEIFQRLGKKEDHEGTGAGLTIVKKIIEMHKGKIWVESKLGGGTTFYFTIPKDKGTITGRKKIGEILVEKELVTEAEVKKALEEQQRGV